MVGKDVSYSFAYSGIRVASAYHHLLIYAVEEMTMFERNAQLSSGFSSRQCQSLNKSLSTQGDTMTCDDGK